MKSDGQKTVVLQNVKIKMDIFYLLKKNECSEIRLKIVIMRPNKNITIFLHDLISYHHPLIGANLRTLTPNQYAKRGQQRLPEPPGWLFSAL